MELVKRVIKVGNSNGIVIPSSMLKRLSLSAGDQVLIKEEANGITIQPTKKLPDNFESILAESLDKYSDALDSLRQRDQNELF